MNTFWNKPNRFRKPSSGYKPDPELTSSENHSANLIGASLDLEAKQDRELRKRMVPPPPTEAEVRKQLGIPDSVEVKILPFTFNGATSIEEAVRRLFAGLSQSGDLPGSAEAVTVAETPQPPDHPDEYGGVAEEVRRAKVVNDITDDVFEEVLRAQAVHGPMNSAHEGHSVIREEFDELWEHVRADTGRSPEARKEAIQLAAMAIRYVYDVVGR